MWSLIRRQPRQKKSLRRTSQSVRPRLEALEDRCLLSAPGTLDPTFGSGGTVTTAVTSGSDWANSVLIQPNGDIIAFGSSAANSGGKIDLVRYLPNGSLDSTFGSGGIVTTSSNNGGPAVLQSDGKIVALGGSFLVRYNSNGSLDTTFGHRGEVALPSGTYDNGYGALLLQPMSDGSEDIVFLDITNVGNDQAIALWRYTPSGQLDTTFGTGGETITDFGSNVWQPSSLALENGDIVVGGGTQASGASGVYGHLWLVARYTANGILDTTFNPNGSHPGIVTTQVGTGDTPTILNSLLVQPSDGKIVAVGQAVNSAGTPTWGLVRYNTDGSLDSTFGNGGIVLSSVISGGVNDMGSALQSNGEIVVAGWDGNVSLEIGVYNSNASPDTTFGNGGFVIQSFNSSAAAYGVAVQPSDGKIVVAGDTEVSGRKGTKEDFFLARYIGTTTSTITPAIATVVKPSDALSQSTASAPPSSMPAANGSTQPADSVLLGIASAPSIPITPANSRNSASPSVSGWSAFQATVLGTLERDLSQWEDALVQTLDQLFADWDQMVHDSFGAKPFLVG